MGGIVQSSNVIRNSIYIFTLFIILFAFSVAFGVTDRVHTKTSDVISNQGITLPEGIDQYSTIKSLIDYAVDFLLVMSVGLIYVSSAVEAKSLFTYAFSFIGSVLSTSILLYLTTVLHNALVYQLGEVSISLAMIPSWFMNNITYIFLLNVLAGLLGFIFVKYKQSQVTNSYAVQ